MFLLTQSVNSTLFGLKGHLLLPWGQPPSLNLRDNMTPVMAYLETAYPYFHQSILFHLYLALLPCLLLCFESHGYFSICILLTIWLCPSLALMLINEPNIFLKADNPQLSVVLTITPQWSTLASEFICTVFFRGKKCLLCPLLSNLQAVAKTSVHLNKVNLGCWWNCGKINGKSLM